MPRRKITQAEVEAAALDLRSRNSRPAQCSDQPAAKPAARKFPSCQLRQVPQLGVIKRVTGTYRYYLTKAGRAATAAAARLSWAMIVPEAI